MDHHSLRARNHCRGLAVLFSMFPLQFLNGSEFQWAAVQTDSGFGATVVLIILLAIATILLGYAIDAIAVQLFSRRMSQRFLGHPMADAWDNHTPMATSNSPTCGQVKLPQAGRADYDSSAG